MSSSSFSGGGGFSPQRSGGYASSEGTVSSDGMTSMEDTMQALNLSASQKREDLRRLQFSVDGLKAEEKRLTERIAMLRQEESLAGGGDEAIRKKDQELLEREHEFQLMKSQMESQLSDREFELSQKQRELQHMEDQLHMKSKDLKQKEFDIMNADSPADLSSGQLAELADRQYELDRKEKDLHYREERLREWTTKLQEKENDYKQRLEAVQRREAYIYSQSQNTQDRGYPGSTADQYPTSHNRTQHPYTAPQQLHTFTQPGTAPGLHSQPGTGRTPPGTSHTPPGTGHTPSGYTQVAGPQYTQAASGHMQSGQYVQPAGPRFHSVEDYQVPAGSSQTGYQQQAQGNYRPANMTAPVMSSQQSPRQSDQTPPTNVPTDRPLVQSHRSPTHQSAPVPRVLEPTSPPQVVPSVGRSGDDQFSRDLELAKQLMKEEEDSLKKSMNTDEMLAWSLYLQEEEMTDGRLNEEGLSVIKKELDERLTEEQRRKQQEKKDFEMAQQLNSDAPEESSTNE